MKSKNGTTTYDTFFIILLHVKNKVYSPIAYCQQTDTCKKPLQRGVFVTVCKEYNYPLTNTEKLSPAVANAVLYPASVLVNNPVELPSAPAVTLSNSAKMNA